MDIKNRIRELRVNANITQAQLGKELGISPETIRAYEAGRREPNSKIMASLEKFFNVSGAYLRGETDQMKWDDYEIQDQTNDHLLMAANRLLNATRKGTDNTNALVTSMLMDLNKMIISEQKFQTDYYSEFVCNILTESTTLANHLMKHESDSEKCEQYCAQASYKLMKYIMELQKQLEKQ